VEFLVGVKREGLRVVGLQADFFLAKLDLHFTKLIVNLMLVATSYRFAVLLNDWVLNHAVVAAGHSSLTLGAAGSCPSVHA
jgi:hypothetical protein